MADRPRSRLKNVTGGGNGVHLRGSGLGTGPVGSGSHFSGGSGGGDRSGGSGGGLLKLIVIVAVLLLGGGGGIGAFLGGSGEVSDSMETGSTGTGSAAMDMAGSLLGSFMGNVTNVDGSSRGWVMEANTGSLNRDVDSRSRAKYTSIIGSGADQVTIMVYMCGTDLERKYGMGSKDLSEMAKAAHSGQVNIIVYTGGCKQWQNGAISNSKNQIWQVTDGGLKQLSYEDDKSMTDPATLTGFITYCKNNYPANRNMLIFWDHGGGSLSGFGYDEKHEMSGSMSLAGINSALKKADMKFDFIGFDACLMAGVETAKMAGNYADYLIASEETEPGVGWYYTDWLSSLAADPSMSTLDLGKQIIDDFVNVCERECRGQDTTLSLVDLSELSETLTDDFKSFSTSTKGLITNKEYSRVSDARSLSREFAASSKIDQVDLVNLAKNMGTAEGDALASTLLSAVKYNRTSKSMTNAFGLSVYFPYRKAGAGKVGSAIDTYGQIGVENEYSDCIREFAAVECAGQGAGASAASPMGSLLGGTAVSSGMDMEGMLSMLTSLTGSSSVFTGRSLSDEATAEYIMENSLNSGDLKWQRAEDGSLYMSLEKEQWALVHQIDLNMFIDDGSGYIDLGLDNIFSFDDNGNLIPDTDGTWLSINNTPAAYYHVDTVENGDDYVITGYVPAFLNGEKVKLILKFDNEDPYGYVAGAARDYDENITETEMRGLIEIKDGDTIDLICDRYDHNGNYDDSYYLGEQIVVDGELMISDTYVGDSYMALYKFTDIYDQSYWSEAVK
ncbi:MAG: peptidase C11 [Lachnospiraceae bacterium]|nr:peptidase C11 [Lachnospiraceae bacterium]